MKRLLDRTKLVHQALTGDIMMIMMMMMMMMMIVTWQWYELMFTLFDP